MSSSIRGKASEATLDEMQWIADPPADRAVATLLDGAGPDEVAPRVDALNAALRAWASNRDVAAWRAAPGTAPAVAAALAGFLPVAAALPPWADAAKIDRAGQLFMDHGALSVTLLFCASLPECYVVPDLAAVLHATGQLEDRAEHRIRTTGAMIFPVMMRGGLLAPDGAGVAQVLKVRLIHATIRHLILRASPERALAASREGDGRVAPRVQAHPNPTMSQALCAMGWDLPTRGLPNNQEELAYTLLTFSYVFLRSLHRLGIAFPEDDEIAYLHAWNVAGHFLGIRRELMADTMDEAAALFATMQARGRRDAVARPDERDARPALAAALMQAMQSVFPEGAARDFPVLLTRHLLEPASNADLGLDGRVPWTSKAWFAALMAGARAIDATARVAFPRFSLSRLVTRAIGYRLTCRLLMGETRPLAVPAALRPGIRSLVATWGSDRDASPRLNALEDRFTTEGDWDPLPGDSRP